MSKIRTLVTASLGLGLALSLVACDKDKEATVNADDATADASDTNTEEPAAEEPPAFPDLDTVLAAEHRSDEHKARDAHRHPKETLEFFGLTRDMTVVELWPGGGWYTEVIGPFLRDEGTYIVTNWPADHERYGKYAKKFTDKLAANPEIYGEPTVITAPTDANEHLVLAPPNSVDMVLTFRNSHGWYNNGQTEQIYRAAYEALKPGGTFGVVQHRAAEGANPEETAEKGYLPEAQVIAAAEAVGFELVEKSEINANPKDTKDYEGGVWTLPPNLGGEQSDEDKAKHAEIGESDRMTLKFRKPE